MELADIKPYKKYLLDAYLLIISVISFSLFYSKLKYQIMDFYELLFSLDWYWYLGVAVLTAIKPVYTIYTIKKRGGKWI